jgi:hypothetical protein
MDTSTRRALMRSGIGVAAAAAVAMVAGVIARAWDEDDGVTQSSGVVTATATPVAPESNASPSAVGTSGTVTATNPPAPRGPVVLRVTLGGKVLREWSVADLQAEIGYARFSLDGDAQEGPLMLKVLDASGAKGWKSGKAIGSGESRAFEIEVDFSPGDVNNTWILDVTKRGTLKLAGENLDRAKWVRDVKELRLQ